MSADAPPNTLSPEQVARREEIVRLTQRGNELYTALQTNAAKRDELIAAEMAVPGVVAQDLAGATGLTVARIYKLRDNGIKRAAS